MKNSENPFYPISGELIDKCSQVDFNPFGATKREYFALHLMQGLLSGADRHSQQGHCETWNYEHISEISIKAADALLNQLEK